ncbi:MAG: hypothetical protein ABGZ35_06125, partial [Planctomycetaceae bacterium]
IFFCGPARNEKYDASNHNDITNENVTETAIQCGTVSRDLANAVPGRAVAADRWTGISACDRHLAGAGGTAITGA